MACHQDHHHHHDAVRIITVDAQVSDHLLMQLRNRLAFESACIRGDPDVVLFDGPPNPVPQVGPIKGGFVASSSAPTVDKGKYTPFWLSAHSDEDHDKGENIAEQLLGQSSGRTYKGLRFHYKKILGQGGFGLATLWQVEFEDGYKEDIVIKIDTTGEEKLSEEHEFHKRYDQGYRTVQTRDLTTMASQHKRGGMRFSRGLKFDPDAENMLVLEPMCHGNLYKLLVKATVMDIRFPNNALWRLWGCLVEGIAEVAYHNEIRQRFNQGFTEMFRGAASRGPKVLEWFFELLSGLPISHDVHFDLDEQNILVSRDQKGAMIFKLHDFGPVHSKMMRKAWDDWKDEDYWHMRHSAKGGKHLPEQRVKEWDTLLLPGSCGASRFQSEDLDSEDKTQVAGRYGSWSNVFMIARTLECVITLNYFTHPFKAKQFHQDDPHVTYGWRLSPEKYPHVDKKLMTIIRRCMRESPAGRDSIIQLLRDLVEARREAKLENDEQTRHFWDQLVQPVPDNYHDYGILDEIKPHSGEDSSEEEENSGEVAVPHHQPALGSNNRVFKIRGAAKRDKQKKMRGRFFSYAHRFEGQVPVPVLNLMYKSAALEGVMFENNLKSSC